ncbi:hypothetical protein LPTSP4_27100 [Leptospira ryugenii]|uniref:Tetratricopeptide repeat protein n=1 Tax=Leptospira ryugenii TaxID=1917863 RepID=A0A2P2E2R7_9LEPT|nr:hypothetical protein [Leptospira ryugenii]GBF51178.1 hypothetical protein LPTSP4_27100 [Leptospira ryugenii]
MKLLAIVFSISLFCSNQALFSQTNQKVGQVFKEEERKAGELHYKRALESFEDRNYTKALEELKLFLVLYLRHPKEWEARKLLSRTHKKRGDLLALAENELQMYKDYPNTEEGLDAYLESARAWIRLGKEEKAQNILLDITKNTYSSKIAQEAELELSQLEILKESKNK